MVLKTKSNCRLSDLFFLLVIFPMDFTWETTGLSVGKTLLIKKEHSSWEKYTRIFYSFVGKARVSQTCLFTFVYYPDGILRYSFLTYVLNRLFIIMLLL